MMNALVVLRRIPRTRQAAGRVMVAVRLHTALSVEKSAACPARLCLFRVYGACLR